MARAMSLFDRVAEIFSGPDERERARILRRRRVAIANAPDGALECVAGRVVASEDGVLAAPMTRRGVVWYRARYEVAHQTAPQPEEWVTEVAGEEDRAFFIDDGSGMLGRVERGARVIVPELRIDLRALDRRSPELQRFLARAGDRTITSMSAGVAFRVYEAAVVEGDLVVIEGVGRVRNEGYRSAAGTTVSFESPVVTVEPERLTR